MSPKQTGRTPSGSEVSSHPGLIAGLRAEYGAGPVVGVSRPRLTWQVHTDDVEWRQEAIEIERRDGDGKVERTVVDTSQQVFVSWPFDDLRSRDRIVVRVRCSSGGRWTKFSQPLLIEVGLLEQEDWRAAFISPTRVGGMTGCAPLLFTDVELGVGIVGARLYVTARGVHRCSINGAPVSEDVLAPGWTSYHERLHVQTYDVTALLRPGSNRLEALVGNGWYRGQLVFPGNRSSYGDRLGLLAQLEVEYDDGRRQLFGTDESWRACASGILADDLYDGQYTDARLPLTSLGSESAAEPVVVAGADRLVLEVSTAPPVRVTEVLPAQSVSRSPAGGLLFDFGQNVVGWVRLTVHDQARGTEVTIRHAEVLEHGELATRPLRSAKATCRYILAGGRDETLVPLFTFSGFRYAEVSGVAEGDIVSAEALILGSDLERTGWFSSSEPLVQRFHDNVVWSARGNFLSVPMDCPQRDERLGWTGDIQVFSPTAGFLFDTCGFLASWLRDLTIEQRPDGGVPYIVPDVLPTPDHAAAGWGDAATVVPWVLFQQFADLELLRRQYPSMRRWVEKVASVAGPDHLWIGGDQFGDWLDPTAPPEDAAQVQADPEVVATAHYARSVAILAKAAAALGFSDEARLHRQHAHSIRRAFTAAYVTADGHVRSDCQTVYALAISWHLLSDDRQRRGAGRRLAELVRAADYRVSTGFLGTPMILDALCEAGEPELAHRMLLQTECPSWLYPVTMGATTIWERWDSMLPDGSVNPGSMTSFNHYAYGAVADWLHRRVAGLAPLEPGYRRVRIAPLITGQLPTAAAAHRSPYGMIRVRWRVLEDGVEVEVDLPPGVSAELCVPGTETVELIGHGRHIRRNHHFIISDQRLRGSCPLQPEREAGRAPRLRASCDGSSMTAFDVWLSD
ncbi:alpha-L-rhamnosidase [Ruania alba]|uniref:alpha-L-rhamnosidase n=1 Tax=Ruania alba TaxID=648782 RepID=A0A1H5L1V4_9MICO|nr:alpha-L-rhamnosidase [Ruania alba]SEE71065.1 alpha-L-rhamnosidase [Ruania alba]